MQTRTELKPGEAKAVITDLLKVAISCHEQHATARTAIEYDQQQALDWAWKSGKALNKIKPLIGHSNWTPWLASHWASKKQHRSVRSAQTYMKIDSDNPNALRVADLKFDTIRKYCIGFVPEKVKPESKDNITFPRLMHHLKIINEINRWKRRRDVGHIEKDLEEERRDFQPEIYWMINEWFSDNLVTLPDGRRALILGDDFTSLYPAKE
jgi:hypothetical protein